MRSIAAKLMSLTLLAGAFASGVPGAGAQPAGPLDSGALGLARSEIEADFGRATEPIEVPGHPVYDETYANENEEGALFVTYRDVNGEEIAVFVEFAWRGTGASKQEARTVAENLLPADAELTELYVAPPTSIGPLALVTYRYESDALGENAALAPEILVIYQERWGDDTAADSTRVEAVSIMIRERTQSTP